MARILITGASGFVGRAAAAEFAKAGHAVRSAVRSPPQPPFGSSIEVVAHADLASPIDWDPVVEGIDAVIHLAAIAHTRRGIPDDRYDRVNRLGAERLAKAAVRAGVGRFIFVSSIRAQTGPAANHVLTEHDRATPTDAYGRSKLAAEDAVRTAGVPFTILRPVLLYGQGAKGNFATLWRAAGSGWPLPIKQFANRRSLLGIDNFISAVNFVLKASSTAGQTYIVADPGTAPSLYEILAILREAQRGRRTGLWPMPTGFIEFPLRMVGRGELWRRIGGDLQAVANKLIAAGWQPLHDTPAGLSALGTHLPRHGHRSDGLRL
ncbi:MAG TPA: NAD-dependent epimerase/dehydratase family protein [Xanthobacteraceae bacterium]|jgi:UDP-glucose 4-epimerase